MSHQDLEVQKLEELLRLKNEETRKLEALLDHARSRSATSIVPLKPPTLSSDYHVPSSSCSNVQHDGRTRSNTVPRRVDGNMLLPDMSLTIPGREKHTDQARPMKRSKTTHPQAHAPPAAIANAKMARSNSTMSMTANRSNPFAGSGPITPPCPTITRNSSLPMNDYVGQHQPHKPVGGGLNYGDASMSMGPPQRQHVESLADQGREMGVAEFLSMIGSDDIPAPTSPLHISPIQIPQSNGLLSPCDAMQFADGGVNGLPSACGSLTSGQTLDTPPMTRNNSNANDSASISGHLSMVRIQSHHSAHGHGRHDSYSQSQSNNHSSVLGKRSAVETDFLGFGANLSGAFAHGYPASMPAESMLSHHQHAMEKSDSQESSGSVESILLPYSQQMERSISKDSTNSVRSLNLRAKEALNRQNLNAAKSRHLQPKPLIENVKSEQTELTDSKKGGKAPIAKAKYERPKHPKVKCGQCNEKPEGFRGEHELRRHIEAKHKSMVKRWICRDPAVYGIPHTERAIKPLVDCKQCSQQKQYGAYYNAAAHLRRTHFRLKPVRKSAARNAGNNGANIAADANAANADTERRGGKGGGDWPPMAELKLWMADITVPMDQPGALVPDGIESIGALEADDMDADMIDTHYMAQNGLEADMGQDSFDMSTTFAGVGAGFGSELDSLDASYNSLQGELPTQQQEVYPVDPAMFDLGSGIPAMPISSSGFNFNTVDHRQQSTAHPALMGLDSNGAYTSPVSSIATITPTAGHSLSSQHILPPLNMAPPRDDLPEMTFDMAFMAAS